MFGRSVGFRLILISTAWIIAALAVGGAVLNNHFRAHVETNFDFGLERHVKEILTYAEAVDGQLVLTHLPTDPTFAAPLSGWYWEVLMDGVVMARSESLWDAVLPLPPEEPPRGKMVGYYIDGPGGKTLRVVAQTVSIVGLDSDITIYFTGPTDVIANSQDEFSETLMTSLILLGLSLIGAVVLQVVLGLRPLKHLRNRLAEIHAGEAERLTGLYPSEVEPLVNDLNELLEHNAQVIERARTHAGNLAHALKTPLAVLTNEADRQDGEIGKTLGEQVSVMNDLVTRHLARARAAGGLGVPGLKADVGEISSGLKRTLQRIYQHKGENGVAISLVNVRGQFVVGDNQDLEEMLGNLMDNACKWAKSRVRVRGEKEGKDVVIIIDDDGPGVPEDKRAEVLARGKRLDEATPGSGLGLNIVSDLAEMYMGGVELDASDLGGLRVRLRLPSA